MSIDNSENDCIVIEKMINETISLYEKLNKHYASRTRPMFVNKNVIEVLSNIVISGKAQSGFVTLCDNGMKDKTFENIILTYNQYFKKDVIESARWRIDNWEKIKI
jgi:oligoendopeptidase F